MTRNEFRRLALGFPDATESSHMGHPDFRVRGRIFATLGYPDDAHAMIKLTPGQQADLIDADPASAFSPSAGAWGRGGSTTVLLKSAERALVRAALKDAWKNIGGKDPGGRDRTTTRRTRRPGKVR